MNARERFLEVMAFNPKVSSLKWEPAGTEWGDYYDSTNYTRAAFDQKAQIVKTYLAEIQN